MNKQCSCPSCKGAQERSDLHTFVEIMERSFQCSPLQAPRLTPPLRTAKDILDKDRRS